MIPMQKKTNQSIKKRFFSATIMKPIITPPPTLAENAILLFVFKFFKINLSAKKTVDAQIIGFIIVAEKK